MEIFVAVDLNDAQIARMPIGPSHGQRETCDRNRPQQDLCLHDASILVEWCEPARPLSGSAARRYALSPTARR